MIYKKLANKDNYYKNCCNNKKHLTLKLRNRMYSNRKKVYN